MFRRLIIPTFLSLCAIASSLKAYSPCTGKVDLGPVYVHLDILESGKTVKTLEMGGVRGDMSLMVWPGTGFCIKPCVLYASGCGELFTGGCAVGHCTPITEWFILTPLVGCNYTSMHTQINIPMLQLRHVRERFRSVSPFIELDVTVKLAQGLRFYGTFQYAWSRTHTFLRHVTHSKSRSAGPAYGGMLEYDLNDKWSINIGGAYNITLTKEKHGLRGAGAKIGFVRWF